MAEGNCDHLKSGEKLKTGKKMHSSNKKFNVFMQDDGNFVGNL